MPFYIQYTANVEFPLIPTIKTRLYPTIILIAIIMGFPIIIVAC